MIGEFLKLLRNEWETTKGPGDEKKCSSVSIGMFLEFSGENTPDEKTAKISRRQTLPCANMIIVLCRSKPQQSPCD